MKRYFYTDPLTAAWMAKRHGMRFFIGNQPGFVSQGVCHNDLVFSSYDRAGPEGLPDGEISDDYYRPPFCVHHESLHLLEPQRRDLIIWINSCGHRVLIEILLKTDMEQAKRRLAEGARIIQRHGMVFHWPESEEV